VKATWIVDLARHHSLMEQITHTGRSACRRIFKLSVHVFGRFMRILITFFLLPESVRNRLNSMRQIARHVMQLSLVYVFVSFIMFLISLLLERFGILFRDFMRELSKLKPKSLSCIGVSMKILFSCLVSQLIRCFLAFSPSWTRYVPISCSFPLTIMRELSSCYML
jgi:hypothetical protein